MWRDEREMMAAEAEAEFEAQCAEEKDLEEGDDDWQPGCDSVSSYVEGGYDPLTDW